MSQTAFPGIMVRKVHASGRGEGAERVFDPPVRGPDFTPDRIQDLVSAYTSDLGDRPRITYTLTVRALSETSAALKARLFARAKNPFEFDVFETKNVELFNEGAAVDLYTVEIKVMK